MKWKKPKWMTPYLSLIENTGGWFTPEHTMNCDDCCNVSDDLCCIVVQSQITLLERLYAKGLLNPNPKVKRGV